MRNAIPVLLLTILLLPACCHAEKSGVLVIVDGLGSSYIFPGRAPTYVDGSPIEGVHPDIVDQASARYELWVPTPETESGNAVIATGYSGASEDTLSFYDATIFDALRKEGYLCLAIMETGDTAAMIAEQDAIIDDQGNSALTPEIDFSTNGVALPAGIEGLLRENPLTPLPSGADHGYAYQRYDDWPLDKAAKLVQCMNASCPGQRYLLTVNVAGTDMAAHAEGYDSYCRAVSGLDAGLLSLAGACRSAGVVMAMTADHGMSFKTPGARGSHASGDASLRNESRLAPLLIFQPTSYQASGTYGQECVAPTLLSLMECPDTLSMRDGVPISINDHPSLYLISQGPTVVTIDGQGSRRQVVVNGTSRIGPLETGHYTITSATGTKAVDLSGDTTIVLAGARPAGVSSWDWLLYTGTSALAAAGIVLARYLVRRR